MHFVWLMTTVVLFISFFDNGNVKGNNLEIQVTQRLQQMTDLKERMESLQKNIEWYISSFLNNNGLTKLNSMVQGLAKEKVYRINLQNKTESMEKAYGQQLENLWTKIGIINRDIENRLSFGSKLEETVRTIEQKCRGSLSNLNHTLENLYKQNTQWRVPKQEMPYCEDGWEEYQGSCYFFEHQNKMPWTSAKEYCDRYNSHLLRIDNQMEFEFIRKVLLELHDKQPLEDSAPSYGYWTGGNDLSNEGEYVWSPRELKMRFTFWSQGEPNSNNNYWEEDCVELRRQYDFKMNDLNCLRYIYFICEKLLLR